MDWSKAKTILIITFLILNVFMLTMILFTGSNELFRNDYIRYAKDYLTSRDIEIKSDIPRVPKSTGKVLYATKEYNVKALCRLVFGQEIPFSDNGTPIEILFGGEKLILTDDELYIEDRLPEGELWFSDFNTFEENLINYLSNIGFNKLNVYLENFSEYEKAKEIVFTIKYKKLNVFDQQISATIDNEGKLTITAPSKEIKKENGKGEVLSAYQILVTGGLPSGVKIENIDIGYRRVSEGDLYGVPVWRIITEDGGTMFYNGYTGERLY